MFDARLSLALVALVCTLTSAAAAPRLAAARPAPALTAWVIFCERHPSECAIDPAEPEILPLGRTALELIQAVNRFVNRSIVPRRDIEHWGKLDQWDLPSDGVGDCEDYQLLKRKLLVEAGLPRRAMRMTVVIDDIGEGHAVLTILTDAGDLILDNKVDEVVPWHEVTYEFIKRESSRSMEWLFLEHERSTDRIAMAR
jgi:predicted transglutaminase-like cysteine proteinase